MSEQIAARKAGSRRGEHSGVPQLMRLAQVAEYLALSERTVRRLVARRALPCVHIGGVLRFDQADVFRFVAARKE